MVDMISVFVRREVSIFGERVTRTQHTHCALEYIVYAQISTVPRNEAMVGQGIETRTRTAICIICRRLEPMKFPIDGLERDGRLRRCPRYDIMVPPRACRDWRSKKDGENKPLVESHVSALSKHRCGCLYLCVVATMLPRINRTICVPNTKIIRPIPNQ